MRTLRLVSVAAALATALQAQTFVVDASNGPGTDFTDLATATAAAPDGATLLVRQGSYGSCSVVGKGLVILGEPGASVVQGTPTVMFSGTAANQRIVVKGLFIAGLPATGHLTFQSCLGPVHVEDVKGNAYAPCELVVDQCPQVSLVRGSFGSSIVGSSDLTAVDTLFATTANASFFPPLTIDGGRTDLAGGSVVAWPSLPLPLPTPAISMNGGVLRLLGPANVNGGTGRPIQGAGTVRAVASVAMSGGLPLDPGITVVAIDEASTSSTAAPLGGIVTGELRGSANLFGGLVFGFPQAPVTFPGIAEELWVDPIGFAISGPLGTPLTFWLEVPDAPVLRGLALGWQGLTIGPSGAVLSNPAWFCLQ